MWTYMAWIVHLMSNWPMPIWTSDRIVLHCAVRRQSRQISYYFWSIHTCIVVCQNIANNSMHAHDMTSRIRISTARCSRFELKHRTILYIIGPIQANWTIVARYDGKFQCSGNTDVINGSCIQIAFVLSHDAEPNTATRQ